MFVRMDLRCSLLQSANRCSPGTTLRMSHECSVPKETSTASPPPAGAGTMEEEKAGRRGEESWETLPSAAESNWGGGIALL